MWKENRKHEHNVERKYQQHDQIDAPVAEKHARRRRELADRCMKTDVRAHRSSAAEHQISKGVVVGSVKKVSSFRTAVATSLNVSRTVTLAVKGYPECACQTDCGVRSTAAWSGDRLSNRLTAV